MQPDLKVLGIHELPRESIMRPRLEEQGAERSVVTVAVKVDKKNPMGVWGCEREVVKAAARGEVVKASGRLLSPSSNDSGP